MKFTKLLSRVAEVEALDRAGDFEAAHAEEAQIRKAVLSAIADEACEGARPSTFAAVALATNPDDNPRRCGR